MGKYEKKRTGKTGRGAAAVLLAVLAILLAGFAMLRGLDHPGDEGGSTGPALSHGTETGFAGDLHDDPAGGFTDETPGSDPVADNTEADAESTGDRHDDPTDEFTEEAPEAPGEEPGADNTEADVEFTDAIVFPLVLENGKLEIENLIQYDGLNPDCGNQEGDNVAAVIVRNLSDVYLGSAEISMKASNGRILSFVVTDLPAGAAAIVFSHGNTAVKSDTAYCDAVCEAVFDPAADMGEDLIGVSVAGTAVTLRNKTSKSLSNIVVYCHCTLGDQYFGGITYTYPIQTLPAGGSTVIEAADCLLGLAEVVRVTINET